MSALYASPPLLRDRSFEATVLGPYILAWQDWLEFRRMAEKTRDNYEQDMAIVARSYPRKAPEDFTPADVMAACNLFPEKARDVRTASVKSFFTWATLMDVIERNPFDKVPSIRQRPRRKDYDIFTEAEVDDLLSLPIADGALMGILFECGLRKAEARKLQVRRLNLGATYVEPRYDLGALSEGEGKSAAGAGAAADKSPTGSAARLGGESFPLSESAPWDHEPQQWGQSQPPNRELNPGLPAHSLTGELTVIGGKGDKDRTVQFGARLHALLQELLFLEPMNPNDYLWYCRPGGRAVRRSQPILEGSFDFWWKRCLETAGVRYRKPHTTRHTFATRWLRRGGRLTTLAEQLGHESIATTKDTYGHLDASDVRQDIAMMEAR